MSRSHKCLALTGAAALVLVVIYATFERSGLVVKLVAVVAVACAAPWLWDKIDRLERGK